MSSVAAVLRPLFVSLVYALFGARDRPCLKINGQERDYCLLSSCRLNTYQLAISQFREQKKCTSEPGRTRKQREIGSSAP